MQNLVAAKNELIQKIGLNLNSWTNFKTSRNANIKLSIFHTFYWGCQTKFYVQYRNHKHNKKRRRMKITRRKKK